MRKLVVVIGAAVLLGASALAGPTLADEDLDAKCDPAAPGHDNFWKCPATPVAWTVVPNPPPTVAPAPSPTPTPEPTSSATASPG